MPRLVMALVVVVALAGCGGPANRAPAAKASASSVLAATVTVAGTATTFQGGDDHLTIRVVNLGRRIDRFAVEAPAWLDEHSFAMGSTRLCDQDASARLIECGAIPAGATAGFTLRSIPSSPGDFEFTFRPYSIEAAGAVPIPDAAGADQVLVYRETVTPVGRQVPGYYPTPSATP
jgi:hypothetical protein